MQQYLCFYYSSLFVVLLVRITSGLQFVHGNNCGLSQSIDVVGTITEEDMPLPPCTIVTDERSFHTVYRAYEGSNWSHLLQGI